MDFSVRQSGNHVQIWADVPNAVGPALVLDRTAGLDQAIGRVCEALAAAWENDQAWAIGQTRTLIETVASQAAAAEVAAALNAEAQARGKPWSFVALATDIVSPDRIEAGALTRLRGFVAGYAARAASG